VEIDSLITKKDSSLVNHVTVNLYVDASKLNRQESEIKTANNDESDFFTKIKENIIYYINPQRIQSLFSATFSAFGNIVIGTLSVFFIAFFFLKEQGLFYEMIKTVVPVQYEQQMMHAIDESSKLLIRYFIGILTQTSIILIYLGLVLKILSIENALLIAFFAAITNVIPYIGPIVGFFVALIITISGNLDVGFYTDLMPQLIRLVIAFGSIQLIDNFILQPVIFSRSVKAHPLEIFFVVMIGAKLGGVTGMVLAIPFYTVFRVLGKVFLSEFKIIQKITKNL
jgi:predicted PurR-regulated permease PerM